MAVPPAPVPADAPATRRRRRDGTELTVTPLAGDAALAGLRAEWLALYEEAAGRNPFADPDWVCTWLRRFAAERDVSVLTVRRSGKLIGVAPCYLRRLPGGVRSVQLAGTARHAHLTELPQVLAAPGEHRSVLRATMDHWCTRHREWDWLELPVEHGQGWFEPEWIEPDFVVRQKTIRPAVVLPLPDDVDTLRASLKRNVTESIRRANNRLDKSGRPWRVTVHTGRSALVDALPTLRGLHGARASLAGRKRHPDLLSNPVHFGFLSDAAGQLAARGRAELYTLDVDGQAIAALLVLRSPKASHLLASGVAPDWWHASPITFLTWAAIRQAVARGDSELNLSMGPDVAKLRWSEHVVTHPEFAVCGPKPLSRLLFTGYTAVAAAAGVRREARRHRVVGR